VAGQPAIEPAVAGRGTLPCTTAIATPSLPSLPALLDAQALIASTAFDGGTVKGGATGGLTQLKVLPTPDLVAQLPTMTAIDAAHIQTVAIPEPLHTTLKALGLPLDVSLDVGKALHEAVGTPSAPILSADVLTARAGVACQAGVPNLIGSSEIAGVKLGGLDLGLNGIVQTAVTVIGAKSIPGTALNPDDVTLLDLSKFGAESSAVAALKDTLVGLVGPIPLPASVLDVKLTPSQQVRDAAGLTERALRAEITLLGQPVLDGVFGEANVNAADGTCAAPPAPTPPATPAAPAPATPTPVAATGSVADQILACTDRKLVLVDVLRAGSRVKLLGAANRAYVGRKVAIRLRATGKVVAHAVVRADGSFVTYAPAPPAALLATHARANRVRYRAEIGREVSLPLKLQRRMVVTSLRSHAGKVTITGRVIPPLTTPRSAIRVVRRVSCHKTVLVGRFKPRADGRFRITVKAPEGQAAAVYRLATRVREKPGNPRTYPTFTLPRGVALNTR
jgi:hypothetical protein